MANQSPLKRAKTVHPKERLDDLVAVIRLGGKNPVRLEAWRYWSIVETLHWFGIDRQTAYDASKRCGRTHEELSFTVNKDAEKGKEVTIELISEGKEKRRHVNHRKQEEAVPEDPGEAAD